jgi:hypothetical protein
MPAFSRRDVLRLAAAATAGTAISTALIPGLCDMHGHSFPSAEISPPHYLANGITTVREMSGTPMLHQWRQLHQGLLPVVGAALPGGGARVAPAGAAPARR